MHKTPLIAHISDLHFGGSNHNPEVCLQLANSLLNGIRAPDFIVVTGDITQWGFRSEMRAARQFLESLLSALMTKRNKIARCIVVRGNHDALPGNFSPAGWLDRLKTWKEVFGDGGFIATDVNELDAKDVTPAHTEGSPLDRWEYFPAFQLAFLKIDSNVKSHWRMASGAVGSGQFAEISVEIEQLEKSFQGSGENGGFADSRRIMLIHHHVLHLPNARHEAEMLLEDAGDLRDRLSNYRIDMILHGHRHRANQAGLIHWGATQDELRTIVLSAGSACARDTDDGHNSYHMIHFGNYSVDVWRPEFRDGVFMKMTESPQFKFRIPFSAVPQFKKHDELPLMLDALDSSLIDAEEHGDREHAYAHIFYTGLIDDDGNYLGNHIFEGKNVSGSATNGMPFHLTAVGAQDPNSFQIQAKDLNRNQDISFVLPAPEKRDPAYVFTIPFLSPLPDGESFRIQVTFKLPRVMLDRSDFDLVNLVRFPRGVDSVRHTLLATRQILMPMHLAVFRRRIVTSNLLVEKAESIDVSWAYTSTGVRTADGFEVNITKPSAQCYLLYYNRLVDKRVVA